MAPPFCKQYQTPFYDNDSIITFETMGTGDVCSLPIFRDVHQIFGSCWTWCQRKPEWITFDLAWRELFGWGLHLEGGKGRVTVPKRMNFRKSSNGRFGPLYRALKRAFQKNCDMIFRKWGGGVKGRLEFFRKNPFWYLHLVYLSVKALLFLSFD